MADIQLLIKIPIEIYAHFSERFKYQSIDDIELNEFGKVGVAIKNGIPFAKRQEPKTDVLDTIQDEIIGLRFNDAEEDFEYGFNDAIWSVRQIIDKHKSESEG